MDVKKNIALNNPDIAILQNYPVDSSLTDMTQGKPLTLSATGKLIDITGSSKVIKMLNTFEGQDRSDVSHVGELEVACGVFDADVSFDMITMESGVEIEAGAYLVADSATKKWKITESGPVHAFIEAVYPSDNYCKVLFDLTLPKTI